MPLEFGWRVNDVRESIWKDDSALARDAEGKVDVPRAAMQAWNEDADASHLEPYCLNGKPQRITFRSLNSDETRAMGSYWFGGAGNDFESYSRALLLCFRMGVNFPGVETQGDTDGINHNIIVRERGLMMLAEPFVHQLEIRYPGIVAFYGKKIYDASRTTEKEKKASSPPSTPTPSSGAASTAATSDPSQPAAGA